MATRSHRALALALSCSVVLVAAAVLKFVGDPAKAVDATFVAIIMLTFFVPVVPF